MNKLRLMFFMSLSFIILFPELGNAILIPAQKADNQSRNAQIEVAEGRIFIGMTKLEAYEARGLPYRVKKIEGEENKEMWIYRCMNSDGFNEDCLYLYFSGDELDKIDKL